MSHFKPEPASEYQVRFISFQNINYPNASNVLGGNGENLQPWHIQELELFLKRMKKQLKDGDSDEAFDLV